MASSPAQFVASLNGLVTELYAQQRYEEALPQAIAALEAARQLPLEDHAELGAALNNLAELYRTTGNPEAAEPLCLEALDVARRTVGEESIGYANCLNNLALLYFTTSRYHEALSPAETAYEIRRGLLETGDPQLENSLLLLSILCQQLGELHDAATYRTLAAESARDRLGAGHLDVLNHLNEAAALFFEAHDLAAAESLFRQVCDGIEATLGPGVDLGNALENLAATTGRLGRLTDAAALDRRVLELRRAALGDEHPDSRRALNQLTAVAEALRNRRDYAAAEPLLQEIADLNAAMMGADSPAHAQSVNNLGALYFAMGRWTDAGRCYEQALDISRRARGPDHPDVARALLNLAVLKQVVGEYGPAESQFKHALEILRGALGEDDPAVATGLVNLAELYAATDRYAAAESVFRQALQIRRAAFGDVSSEVASVEGRLASVVHVRGDDQQAVALLRHALAAESVASGADHPAVVEHRDQLIRLLEATGDRSGAETLLTDALAQAADAPDRLRAARQALIEHHLNGNDYQAAAALLQQVVDDLRQSSDVEPTVLAAALGQLADVLAAAGDSRRALALRLEVLELLQEHGEQHPLAVAAGMTALAQSHQANDDSPSALPLYQQAVQVYQRLGRPAEAIPSARAVVNILRSIPEADHGKLAFALNNLAEAYRQSENPAAAVPLLEEALASLRAAEDEDDLRAAVLNNLGLARSGLGQYQEARRLLEQSLAIYRERTGLGGGLAFALNNLAETYSKVGDFRRAEPLLRESLEVRHEVFGPDSAPYAIGLNNLGRLLLDEGNLAEAKPVLEDALATGQRVLGSSHPDVARTLGILAYLYRRMGDLAAAENLLRLQLSIQHQALPADDPAIAYTMDSLADVLQASGDYDGAERLYREAGSRLTARLGDRHPEVGTNLNGLGLLLSAIGKDDEAEGCYQRALDITQSVGDEVGTATILNNLALLRWRSGRPAAAVEDWRRALELRQANLPADSPDIAQALNNLATALTFIDPDAAEAMLTQALETRRRVLGDEHPDVAETLNNMAVLRRQRGDLHAAESLLEEALRIRRRTSADGEPKLAQTLSNLGLVSAQLGRTDQALNLIREAAAVYDVLIEKVFSLASERQRTAYLAPLQGELALALSVVLPVAADRPDAVRTAFDLVLRRKAIVAEGLAAQRDALLGARYPQLTPRLEELTALRAQIAARMLAGSPYSDEDRNRLAEWDTRRQDLEAGLARQIPDLQLNRRMRSADRATIAAALPQDSALIEFIRIYPFDIRPDGTDLIKSLQPARYLAFVLPAGAPDDIRLLDLGEAGPVDHMVAFFRSTITREPEIQPDRLPAGVPAARVGDELRRRIFDPVRTAAGDRQRLFLAPDGDLTRLPFEVLPVGDGRWVIDDFLLSYLSVGRDLAGFTTTAEPVTAPLVIADPDFDLSDTPAPGQAASADVRAPRAPDLARAGLRFDRLPGTRTEGEHIAALLNVRPLLGAEALKRPLKEIHAPEILHIATHGFFLPDRTAPQVEAAAAPSPSMTMPEPVPANPLLRSGLALAGANAWATSRPLPEAAEDGLLTAEDVATMNLVGTRLVVLSACETGLGDVRVGEGVFGLRRAFMLAGAETLVMSLWNVPDQETREVMEHYYSEVVRAGRGRAEALRAAQLAVRQHRPDDPYYWGAFICQGNPGRLSGRRDHATR
jgi:tetratricopeptide (TPR) repeat protein/CHAT domain-containing protein